MVVALIALVFALSGTAIAATKLVSGDKLIKKDSLSGNRLRSQTVTGTQINAATLGKVPSAAIADTATHAATADTATKATNATHATLADNATHATSAASATNATHAAAADTLAGIGPGVFGTELRVLGDCFHPRSSGTGYAFGNYGGITWSSGNIAFIYPLQLPQGAKITKLTMFYANTTDGFGTGSLELLLCDLKSTTHSYFVASPTGSGYGSATYTFGTPLVVDNTAWAYALEWFAAQSTVNEFLGAEVDYTLP